MKKVIYEVGYGKGGELSKYDMLFKSLEANSTQVDMRYSTIDKQWSVPGEKIGSLYDNGNGVSVNVQGKHMYLDYAQVEYMRLLLHAYDQANSIKNPRTYPARLLKLQEAK